VPTNTSMASCPRAIIAPMPWSPHGTPVDQGGFLPQIQLQLSTGVLGGHQPVSTQRNQPGSRPPDQGFPACIAGRSGQPWVAQGPGAAARTAHEGRAQPISRTFNDRPPPGPVLSMGCGAKRFHGEDSSKRPRTHAERSSEAGCAKCPTAHAPRSLPHARSATGHRTRAHREADLSGKIKVAVPRGTRAGRAPPGAAPRRPGSAPPPRQPPGVPRCTRLSPCPTACVMPRAGDGLSTPTCARAPGGPPVPSRSTGSDPTALRPVYLTYIKYCIYYLYTYLRYIS